MAPFLNEESDWSRLDYRFLRDGGVILYHSDFVLEEDLKWLREEKYVIHDFDARGWKTGDAFHDDVAEALEFPDYYGENLDAFNDCMRDVDVPPDGGMAIVIRDVDSVELGDGRFVPIILDILAGATRTNLLFGRRLLTLLQSRNPAIEFPVVGAMPVIGQMKTAKEEVRELLEKLPDDASLDDIQYHIYVCQKIQKGLDAADRGEVISQAEVERRMGTVAREIIWTDPGWDDVENAANYIAQDSEFYAAAFVQEIKEAVASLANFAERGQVTVTGRRWYR